YVGRGSVIYSQAVAEHPLIQKVAFTGSTATVRRVQEASSKSDLKAITLALGALISSSMTRTSNKPSSGCLWVSSLTMVSIVTLVASTPICSPLWLRPHDPIPDIPSKR
ncbi:hypothetical protein BDZ89DRAFT_1078785, partial [Hymenopellis radicata]